MRAPRADEVEGSRLRLLDDELRQDVPGTDGWRWTPEGFRTENDPPQSDPAVASRTLLEGLGGTVVGAALELRRPDVAVPPLER